MPPNTSLVHLPSIVERLRRYTESDIDETISPHDNMYEGHRREHYFAAGHEAISIITMAMIKSGIADFSNVMDLPCGSGRVLRHLVRFFPEASVIASDIDPDHVEFCVRQFGAEPLLSQENLRLVSPNRSIDLLFCGSLLTHFSKARFKATLRCMIEWLAPGGLAIFTLHGRWPVWRQAHTPYKYMPDELFENILRDVSADGFGYIDYEDSGSLLGQQSYGFSVSLPSWVMSIVEGMDDVRLLDYVERGWDNHQDVLIMRKIPISARPWLFEDRGGQEP